MTVLLEFKAGKMTLSGTTVTADPRRGIIQIRNLDGMIGLIWKEVNTTVEDQPFVLFPDDAVFRKCKSCPTGRVFYLKFANDRREFYWMQDLSNANDDTNCAKVNELINNPLPEPEPEQPAPPQSAGDMASSIAAATPALQPQLRRMFGVDEMQTPATTATPFAPPPLPGRAGVAPVTPAGVAPQSAAIQQMIQMLAQRGLTGRDASSIVPASLTDILAPANVEPLLADPAFVARLASVLPPGASTASDVREHILSAQYAQAVESFNEALQSGGLGSVMVQFGVDPAVVAQNGGGLVGLCVALQQQEQQQQSADGGAADGGAAGGDDAPKPMDEK